ncbi:MULTISPECIES: group-specific protein [unclassified Bacillus (in: firmicutes)]|uniref:group-specific protein n=1 Tax=unclassified Bacillus (in: firmicutes) TaxID=185979 RepID=UPI001BEA5C08|nr:MULTISPECIES: group-specific protein [unclassified Bacillus (in: firmicutes)]MBT2618682.1 group-specific protein [Bacillus sp. ISL-78]MBT2632429.1 group-specific protein [Bacillus sp. ISL-101]MBT2717120.1 group-specific protein [Bacillus sp. ISL-57]
MQEYIYHMVPKEMIGDKLIPLNALGKISPHLYEKYTKKYFDHPERPKLLKKQIPKLNCLWNDVLHFIPLHPYYVYEALTSLGIKTKEEQQFLKIPIEKLTNNTNAIYLYTKEKYKGPAEEIEEDEIKLLNIETYKELKEIPSASIEYYKIENEKGNRIGLFPYIPHLLSLGEVEINDVEIVSWNHFK